MTHRVLLTLILIVSVSSASLLKKSFARRQTEPERCQAIQGFDCKCSYYRVTCTSDGDLQSSIVVLPNEREKYQSVELVINGERDYNVYESTFEPVRQLYKPDADNLEFRIKFEKFTALHLQSPGVFNRVFPDNLPANARKHMALEIYNPVVQPHDNPNLFQNVNVDSLELYVLYPFQGTFQQLFQGANIKYLRLSGGDISSDLSQPFSGNIGRLELAKQASSLSVQNFPVYPAHEMVIDAFYVSNFNDEHPPNYSNLGEIRIYTHENVPANAFRQFPNIHTLSISTEKNIDPQAFNGLTKLEKLTIKDTKPSLELLTNLPQLKEFETSVSKLDEQTQCQLIEKLANGQVAIQAIPNGHECTCVSAYVDSASGRYPCNAQDCDQSSCAAIRNNYDASTRTFKAPPTILRSDGTDALRPREPRVYTAPFQVSRHDQEKLQQGQPAREQSFGYDTDAQQHQQGQHDAQQQQQHSQHQQSQYDDQQQQQVDNVTPAGQPKKSRRTKPRNRVTTPMNDQGQHVAGDHHDDHQQYPEPDHAHHPDPHDAHQDGHQAGHEDHDQNDHDHSGSMGQSENNDNQQGDDQVDNGDNNDDRQNTYDDGNQQDGGASQDQSAGDGTEAGQGGEGSENDSDQSHIAHETASPGDSNQATEVNAAVDGSTESMVPAKKGIGWLPIIIIAACILGLILALLIFFFLRKRNRQGYNPAATKEPGAGTTARA